MNQPAISVTRERGRRGSTDLFTLLVPVIMGGDEWASRYHGRLSTRIEHVHGSCDGQDIPTIAQALISALTLTHCCPNSSPCPSPHTHTHPLLHEPRSMLPCPPAVTLVPPYAPPSPSLPTPSSTLPSGLAMLRKNT